MRTVNDIVRNLPQSASQPLSAPIFSGRDSLDIHRVGLCVPSMKRHMTDEGWQIFLGLQKAGYALAGHGVTMELEAVFGDAWTYQNHTDVKEILDLAFPKTVVLQDKREWIGRTAGRGFDTRETFYNVNELAKRPEIFRVGVLKDAHSDEALHRESALEAGLHAWIVYYHPDIVARQAPFVRRQHLIRTYHSVDPTVVPKFGGFRDNSALLSGARSGAYPMRSRLWLAVENGETKNIFRLPHPGYGRTECHTPAYLNTLSMYKVAICTSSRWGYALRKIIESSAAGCRVITDLPVDDVLPGIDANLYRVDSDSSPKNIDELVRDLCNSWDEEKQRNFAKITIEYYDYREVGKRLAEDIEKLRVNYATTT